MLAQWLHFYNIVLCFDRKLYNWLVRLCSRLLELQFSLFYRHHFGIFINQIAELKIGIMTNYWTLVNVIFLIFFSFLLYIMYSIISNYFFNDMMNVTYFAFSNGYLYMIEFFVLGFMIIFMVRVDIRTNDCLDNKIWANVNMCWSMFVLDTR